MVDQEELRRERDENISGVAPKDMTMAAPVACRGCSAKEFAVCLCCINYPICNDDRRKPGCWVSEKCRDCERREDAE